MSPIGFFIQPATFLFSSRFDLILDNVGGETERWAPSLLRPWGGSKYITLVTPFLRNTDALGIADGMVKTAASMAASVFKVNGAKKGCAVSLEGSLTRSFKRFPFGH